MLDSGTKLPENRIHLFDPVGLINDGYGGYRSSAYAVKPRRPTKSYGNFEDVSANNGGLKSCDSFTDHTNNGVVGGSLRPYNSLTDADSVSLRSYDSFSMELHGGGIRSYDHNTNDDINGGGIRFGGENNIVEDEVEVATPRLWKPSLSPPSPKAVSNAPLHPTNHSSNLKSLNSSHLQPTSNHISLSPRSLDSSPLHPSFKPMNSNSPPSDLNSLHTTTSKSVKFSPLHTSSSPKSVTTPMNPTYNQYHQTMSPSSRTQAIAKGRRELMDMVRDLPETFYELSLKDIVEQRTEMEVQKDINIAEEKKTTKETTTKPKETKKQGKSSNKVKKSESKKKMMRSKSVDNGRFLLRTSVFPIFTGSRKNKKNLGGSNSFKIAPMPKPQATTTGSMKGVEKDWWRRKSCISSESEESNGLSSKSESSGSSSSSSRSNSDNGRRSNRFLPSCCLFNGRRIRSKKMNN